MTSSTNASSSVVVKAKWNPKKYTITYDNNNGEGCNTKNGNYDQPWGDLCVPTRKGYTFAGWTKDGTAVTKDTICKANITVKANWTINSYTLTFDSNKGTDCSPKTITKEYNSKWGTLCATTRTGYKFGGWFNDDKEVTADSKATKTITVKAKWTANKYTLTYDDNGGTGCSDSSIKESYGNAWGTLCTPTKAGHTFVGWNTKKEGTGTTVTKSTTVGASNIKVFAQWTANACTLTYVDSKGTGCNNSTISTTYGNTWGTLCGPTRTHYTFAGWNTKSDGTGTNVSSTTSTTNVCDSNVYPKWTKNKYVLSYEGTGSEKCSSITKEYNSEWGTLCTPTTQTHYTFAGWFNGDTEVTNSSKATATITVTSRWNTKKYKLTYNSDGGTACSEKSVDYDTAWGTLCEPTKSGYTFKGWFNSSGTEVKSSTVCKGNESVTAKWAANSKAVTISSSGYGTSSTIYISLSATNPDTSQNISATATSGTATCSYSGSTINCTVKNVSNKTVTNDTDCTKWAQANGVSGTVKYLTNKEYNYSKWAKDATAGCYLQVSSSARTKDTWTCMYTAAKDSFFKGSESHCTKEACGYSDCLTRGYNDLGSGYRSCKCWRKVGNNITTYYDTTVTVTYYQYT